MAAGQRGVSLRKLRASEKLISGVGLKWIGGVGLRLIGDLGVRRSGLAGRSMTLSFGGR